MRMMGLQNPPACQWTGAANLSIRWKIRKVYIKHLSQLLRALHRKKNERETVSWFTCGVYLTYCVAQWRRFFPPSSLVCLSALHIPFYAACTVCGFQFVIILVNFLFVTPLPGLPGSCLSHFNLAAARFTTNIKVPMWMPFTIAAGFNHTARDRN